MKYLIGVLIVLILAGAGYFWYGGQPKDVASVSLCNDTVTITSIKTFAGEAGPMYTVKLSYQSNGHAKEIFSLYDSGYAVAGSGRYAPLPILRSVPVLILDKPHNVDGDLPPNVVDAFVDPSNVTRTEFDAVAACLKNNPQAMNDIFTQTPHFGVEMQGSNPVRFGGMAYLSVDGLVQLVKSVNTNPPSQGASDSPMVNQLGAVIYDTNYVGNIFDGVIDQHTFESLDIGPYADLLASKNSDGENIYQYVARIQQKLKSQ